MSEDLGQREVYLRVEKSAAQTISGGATTTIVYDNIDSDSTVASWHDDSTGITTIGETGLYSINVSVRGTSSVVTGDSSAILMYAGGLKRFDRLEHDATNASNSSTISASAIVKLVKGDTVYAQGQPTKSYALSGGTSSTLEITKLPSPQTILETETVAARYTTNAGQSIPSAAYTTVAFQDIDYDTHSIPDGSDGFTASVSGIYDIKALVNWAGLDVNIGEVSIIRLLVNGTAKTTVYNEHVATATLTKAMTVSDRYNLDKGDIVTVQVYQNTGAAETLEADSTFNAFSMARLK